MLAIARFSVPLAQAFEFRAALEGAHEALSNCAGFISGETGRNLDDPTLWVLMTSWKDVGSYRRALSSIEVKMRAVPLLAQAIDEPGAYHNDASEGAFTA
ncbi:MAG: antibiotic biosynthesis monooxygenase [Actinobacteria bacterium]|nr:antibiotic biosynthesis monooxygenase [Actinomycetota bacterium]